MPLAPKQVRALEPGQLNNYAVRDMAAAAWTVLNRTPQNVSLAVRMMDTVFASQLPDGQFPWSFGQTTCIDPNSVQFTSLPLLRSLLAFKDQLPVGYADGKRAQLALAAQACWAETLGEATPYYTNIYTMVVANLQLFAQLLGNATVQQQADTALKSWTTLVDAAGIHEYASPTYTAVALVNLYINGQIHANTPKKKKKKKKKKIKKGTEANSPPPAPGTLRWPRPRTTQPLRCWPAIATLCCHTRPPDSFRRHSSWADPIHGWRDGSATEEKIEKHLQGPTLLFSSSPISHVLLPF
jgi:hypothetical protein